MNPVFTHSICHVDCGALARNFARLGEPENLLPVIKADAYGHGLARAAETLAGAGALQLAAGSVSEGSFLRRNGFKGMIAALLGCLDAGDWRMAIADDLTPVCGSLESLKIAAAAADGRKTRLALKCDTGMSRLGLAEDELPEALSLLDSAPWLRPEILMSHLACSDAPEEDGFTRGQIEKFNAFHAALRDRFPRIRRSLANSAAALAIPESRFDLCRTGLALYGVDPAPARPEGRKDFEPVMSVSAPILQIRTLKPGDSVSYGRAFTAEKPVRAAIISAGYAAGVARALSNRMSVLAHGRRAPQIGRICMSMLAVDISAIPEARAGDRVWLLGGPAAEGEKAVTVQELADLLGAIPYEALCLLGSLNPRVYETSAVRS